MHLCSLHFVRFVFQMNDLLEQLTILFDSKFGVLTDLGLRQDSFIHPDFFRQRILCENPSNGIGGRKVICSGVSLFNVQAKMSAVYEGIERHCYLLPYSAFRSRIKHSSDVDPKLIFSGTHFSTTTAEHQTVDDKKTSEDIYEANLLFEAEQLGGVSRKKVNLPIDAIFNKSVLRFAENTTNGMGAGQTKSFAEQSAIYELIERDAFQYAWLTQSEVYEIELFELTKLSKEISDLLSRLNKISNFLKIRLLKTAIGDYSAVASIQTNNEHDLPAYSMSSAYRPNITDAIHKALLELVQICSRKQKFDLRAIDYYRDFNNIKSFNDHGNLFYFTENLNLLGIFNHNQKQPMIRIQDLITDKDFESTLIILNQKNIRLFVADLTSVEFEGLPVYVAKAISPDLLPLNASHQNRPNGHARLQNQKNICEVPHPFP